MSPTLSDVECYIKKCIKYFMSNLDYFNKDLFIQKSYQIWAGKELLNFLRRRKKEDPDGNVCDWLDEFREMVDDYACRCSCICFSVAYDVATDVFDFLIGEY